MSTAQAWWIVFGVFELGLFALTAHVFEPSDGEDAVACWVGANLALALIGAFLWACYTLGKVYLYA